MESSVVVADKEDRANETSRTTDALTDMKSTSINTNHNHHIRIDVNRSNIDDEETNANMRERNQPKMDVIPVVKKQEPTVPVPVVVPGDHPITSIDTLPMHLNSIRMISQDSIQRIVSGQAIYDLASCVKELIDNSIDAHSQTINSTYSSRRHLDPPIGCVVCPCF